MADPSRPPTFKAHNVPTPAHCAGCGKRVTYDVSLWFTGNRVFCFSPDCVKEAAKA